MGVDPVSIAVVGIGIGLMGQRRARRDAKSAQRGQMAFDTKSARLESKALLEEAALEAIEIRREGELLGKTQTSLTAKAGLKLGRGTARDIQEETKRLTEKDVATTLGAAERKSEQILSTFGAGAQTVISTTELENLETRATSLELQRKHSNFMKSKAKSKPLFGWDGA